MRILLVSQYFYPESFIINDLVKCLAECGHTIELLTTKPNYPDGIVFDGYKAGGYVNESFLEHIVVHRIPIFPRGKGVFRRLLNYLSFILSGIFYFHRCVKEKEFDVIFVFVPSPITSVIPAIYLKKRLKLPLAVWVQDLWPETLSATGFVKNRWILRVMGRIVRWIYAQTDMLLIQSEAFREPMLQYTTEEKIIYYPNSYLDASAECVQKVILPKPLLHELERNFCLIFAGNLGTAQSLETLVEAAVRVKHLVDCRLVLVGSGSMSQWVQDQILAKDLNNLILAGRFSATTMPAIFSLAKGLLVTLKQDEIFTHIIPSKIQAYLAAGKPILAALDGEGAQIIEKAGAGFSSPAEDAIALAQNIERLYAMPLEDRELLGASGRAYFLQHFEMMRQSKCLIDILENTVNDTYKQYGVER